MIVKKKSTRILLPVLKPAAAAVILLNSISFIRAQEPDKRAEPENDFLPGIGILVDAAAFSHNKPDYSGVTHRIVGIDIFRMGKYVFSSKFDEGNFYRGMKNKWFKPFRIQYYTEFLNFRREFESVQLSVFADHVCNNIIDEYTMTGPMEKYQIGWYRYGIKIETPGNRIGYKNRRINFNDGIGFSFLGNVDYRISAGKTITSDYGYFKAIADGSVRIDLFKWRNLVAYTELSCFTVWDWKAKADFGFEIGSRIHFNNIDVTPFAKFSYAHNVDYYDGMTAQFKSIGIRLETLFENRSMDDRVPVDSGTDSAPVKKTDGYPQMHFAASYGKYISNKTVNFNQNLKIGVDIFKIRSVSPYLSARLSHNSMANQTPWPRYLEYGGEAGVKYFFSDYESSVYCSYTSRNDANYRKDFEERYVSVGAVLSNREMSSPYSDSASDLPGLLSFVNKLGWRISGEGNAARTNYRYQWKASAGLRWKIVRISFATFYVLPSVEVFIDKNKCGGKAIADKEYFVESGLGLSRSVDFSVFYRFGKIINIDRVNGIKEKYHLVGLKMEI